jgi:hypothetical protein
MMMRGSIGIIAAGLLVAFITRRFVTYSSGLTYTTPSVTRYVPYNIVAFWLSIAITAILCSIYCGRQMRR